jgi:diguanylate cyclase (GGDEF)-like protein
MTRASATDSASLPSGQHLCSFYENREEQFAAVVAFLKVGLEGREKCLYIAPGHSLPDLRQALSAAALEGESRLASGQLLLLAPEESSVDPEKMLDLLHQSREQALRQGYQGLRAATEMTWVLFTPEAAERLREYERRLEEFPGEVSFLCQYDLKRFPAPLLLEALSLHPQVLCGERACSNDYYLPPQERLQPEKELRRKLSRLEEQERLKQRLREQAEEKEQLSRVMDFSKVIVSSLDLQEVYDAFIALLRGVMEVNWGTIALIEGDKLQVIALSGELAPPWKLGVDTPIKGTATEWLLAHRQPLLSSDLAEERRFWTDKVAFKRGTRSILRYPLFHRGEVFGILSLGSQQPHAFGDRELAFIDRIADQLALAIYNSRLFRQMQQAAEERMVLAELTRILASSLQLEEVYEAFARELKRVVDFDRIHLVLVRGANVEIYAVYPGADTQFQPRRVLPLKGTALEWVIKHRQSIAEANLEQQRLFSTDEIHFQEGMRSVIRIPLFARGEVFGELVLSSSRPGTFQEREQRFLEQVAGQVAMAIYNTQLYQETLQLSQQDSLTGLYHHREFYRRLEQEIIRAKRYCHPLSLLIIDLDNFKEVNTRYGHLTGDVVLQEFSARVLEGQSRSADILARYGGDEFALILVETPEEGAEQAAGRLLEVTRKHQFTDQKLRLSLSIGVAAFPRDGDTAEELVKAADEAMFRAKQQGGDTMCFARGGRKNEAGKTGA